MKADRQLARSTQWQTARDPAFNMGGGKNGHQSYLTSAQAHEHTHTHK